MKKEIEEVDLTKKELKMIAERMNEYRYITIAKMINEQIDCFMREESNYEELKKFKKFFNKKINKKKGISISNQIFWLWIMLNDNKRKKFNSYYEDCKDIKYLDTKPLSDMRDIYLNLLYRKYINCEGEEDIDNDILNNEYFNILKEENMRKNFKTFLEINEYLEN